jgi:transcription elongation factor GreA
MNKSPITNEGFIKISTELKHLKTVDRPNIIKAIAEARELGDLSENAEYQSAREKQSFIEGRILQLEDIIARSEVIDVPSLSGTTVKFGATVQVLDLDTEIESYYKIVGDYEADLKNKQISISSPIAKALIGKSTGDTVEVNTPTGVKELEILGIAFK